MTIAILVPTLKRPAALRPLLQSVAETTAPGDASVVFVVDHDDPATHLELQEAWEQGWRFGLCFADGTYPQKVNAGFGSMESASFVLPGADDVVLHSGWLEHAMAAFQPGVEVVGTNDLTPITSDGRHATMPIVRRSYVEDPGAAFGEPGVLFHEGYHHSWVETELCQLAQHRGVYVSCPTSIVEHRHHAWGTREVDDTDRKGNMRNQESDEALFEKRQARWLA